MGAVPPIYIFDTEDPRWRRPWDEMLPAATGMAAIRDAVFVDGSGDPLSEAMVIIHASSLPDADSQRRLLATAGAHGLHLVLISGGHQTGTPGDPPHVYRRRAPVRVRAADPEFARCIHRFVATLATGERARPELLEPDRPPLEVLAVLCRGWLLARAPGEAGTPPTPEVRQIIDSPAWWAVLDPHALQALAAQGASRPAVTEVAAVLTAGQTPSPEQVEAAWVELSAPGGD